MQFSRNWLKEFVDFKVSDEELCEQLTMLGLEVDNYKPYESKLTGKDAVIYKEGWGDQYKMLFVTTYESMGETEEVGEKVMADKRITDWLQNGMTNGDLISGAVDRFFTTIKDTRE